MLGKRRNRTIHSKNAHASISALALYSETAFGIHRCKRTDSADQTVAMTYPPSDHVEVFTTNRSGWCVFSSSTDKRSFLALLDALGRQSTIEVCSGRVRRTFRNPSVLEERFREYASKDYGPLCSRMTMTEAERSLPRDQITFVEALFSTPGGAAIDSVVL